MRNDIPYQVTIDRRDLFDFVRGAIKATLDDYADAAENVECWAWQEANDRATEVLAKLKLPALDAALSERADPEVIRARCKALNMAAAVAEALIAANCT
jgi:hypothetical protein